MDSEETDGGTKGTDSAYNNIAGRMRSFLEAYSQSGRLKESLQRAGIAPNTHYRRLESNPAYRAAFAQAQKRLVDVIEDELFRRGVDGESDAILMFLARGHMPDKYRDRASLDVSGTINLAEKIKLADQRLLTVKRIDSPPDAA